MQADSGVSGLSGICGGAAGSPFYLKDTFTGADSTDLTAHTMDVGGGWTAYNNSTWVIQSNRAACSVPGEAQTQVAADAGHADVNATVTINFGVDGVRAGICGRLSDGNNAWEVYFQSDGTFNIIDDVAGSRSLRASGSATAAFNTDYTLNVIFQGTNITGSINGSVIANYASATFNQTATRFGLWTYGDTGHTRWDTFQAMSP